MSQEYVSICIWALKFLQICGKDVVFYQEELMKHRCCFLSLFQEGIDVEPSF